MKRKIKWTEEVLRYLFEMAVAVTEYRTTYITPKRCITAEGRRKLTKLMGIKYNPDDFRIGNVSQVLYFVSRGQKRSVFKSTGHQSIFDRAMHAAKEEGFITGSEFAERMTT
tara:strand:+ start:378 stop:713 length:336 start_codon:yes stop_codon:yes gene_type:complete